MCHLSMKLSDMFDQNPPCTFDKIREKPHSDEKCSHVDTYTDICKTICQGVNTNRKMETRNVVFFLLEKNKNRELCIYNASY